MQAWKALGSFISQHMIIIVPICVALGVALPEAFSWLRPAVSVMFAFITFQGSLSNSFHNLADTFRHPLPMLFALAISQVIMPLIGYFCGTAFFADPDLVCGIVLQWSVPVAVTSTLWVGIYEGNMALALGTLLISTVLSPVTIPATLQLLMGATVEIDARGMIVDMLLMVAIPALVATALNDRTAGRARRELSPVLSPAARILVILVITTNATSLHDFMLHLTPELVGVMVFAALMITLSYVLGVTAARLLRLDRDSAISLAFCSALKNISSGAVIAQAYFAPITLYPVMVTTIFNQFLAAVYGHLLSHVFARYSS